MAVPRVLLLSTVAPSLLSVGRIFLRDLCTAYPRDRICCFHLQPVTASEQESLLDWLPTRFAAAPGEYGYYGLGERVAHLSRPVYEKYVETTKIPRLVEKAVRFGKEQRVDLVWAVIETPTTIRMASSVADQLGLPLVGTVWDPPAYVLRDYGYRLGRYTLTTLLTKFDDTLAGAVRCGVASEGMKLRYERRYGTDCIVMIHGFGERVEADAPPDRSADRPLVIGVAGSIRPEKEWCAFVAALASRDWQIAGRKVVLRLLSSKVPRTATLPVWIEFLGWREPVETVRLLSQADLAYLPYWFDTAYEDIVQLTFPNKLAAYVAARVPTFYHGPAQSSPMAFFELFPVGLGCHSLDASEIIESLERMATSVEFTQQARLACDQAFEQELSAPVFRRRFAELIGVETKELFT